VSCGRILDCVRVEAPDATVNAGPLRVSGPAICSEIIRATGATRSDWVETGDLAVLADGELFVTGRSDDLICVGGRNVFAWELESAVCSLSAVREGDCAVVADGRGRYAALFEARGVARDELDPLVNAVRRKLASQAGIGPSAVGCLPKGMLPKTPSGKIRRNRIAADLGDLSRACLAYQEF
jgi:acyl-coenzyme A synthetase/AMP-(fatty) acid ligase